MAQSYINNFNNLSIFLGKMKTTYKKIYKKR